MTSLKTLIASIANKLSATKPNLKRPFTVIVEGNIGCGKTTFLQHFKKFENVCILAEPIGMWRNCNGHNLLGLMYQDPKKWTFTFQSYVQLTMLQQHSLKTDRPIKLMERSIYSARYCFVEKLARDGVLNQPSTAVLDEWFKWITTHAHVDVDLIVYLRSSPEVAYERLLKRDRNEEKAVPLNYLQDLHEIHENWLYHKTLHTCPAPVIVLNVDKDESVIQEEYSKSESRIFNGMTIAT